MDKPENVATPLTALIVAVPPKTALAVPLPLLIEMVTDAVEDVIELDEASWIATAGCTPKARVAVKRPEGDVIKASLVATPRIAKAAELALVSPVDVAVRIYPVPARLMDNPENVATPFTAF